MRDLFKVFKQVLIRDLQIYAQHKGECLSSLLFFVIVVTLFALVAGPLSKNLLWLVPVIIWVAALLAILLAQESLFRADYQSGVFEQFIMSPYPLSVLLLAKIVANWLVTGLALTLITPLLALSFALPMATVKILTLSILLGTPTLCLLGSVGGAITLSLQRGGLLLAVLILPLYIPILVLGTSVGILSLEALPIVGHLALLAAIAIAALLLVPLAISFVIKVSMA